MPKRSAGLLPFRITRGDQKLEIFIVHPGGPFWAKKDDRAWSIPKGEYEDDEDPSKVAEREFSEELGVAPPTGNRVDLGELRQPSGKRIRAWAVEAPDFEVAELASNEFEMEWPPKSGVTQSFPEVDRARWVSAAVARKKLVKGQVGFVDLLLAAVRRETSAVVH